MYCYDEHPDCLSCRGAAIDSYLFCLLWWEPKAEKVSHIRYGSKGALEKVVRKEDFSHSIAERASVHEAMVFHNIGMGAPPKLKQTAGHLSKARRKFAQIKLGQVDIPVEKDLFRFRSLPTFFRKTNFEFCLWAQGLRAASGWAPSGSPLFVRATCP